VNKKVATTSTGTKSKSVYMEASPSSQNEDLSLDLYNTLTKH